MPKAENMLQKIKNSKDFEELYELCKEINPDITQKEVENEMKKLSQVDDEKLEEIAGGKMNFNKTKALAVAALLPFAATAAGGVVHAGNTASHTADEKLELQKKCDYSEISFQFFKSGQESAMKERKRLGIFMEDECYRNGYDLRKLYYERDKIYAPDDMARLRKGTFNAPRYFRGWINFMVYGPWRLIAFKRAESGLRFKDFMDKLKRFREELQDEMLRRLESSTTGKHPVRKEPDLDPELELVRVISENKSFEEFVDVCRRDWNEEHDYKSEVKSYEDAFRKALLILKQQSGKDEDPFYERRVEVLHDVQSKIYIVRSNNFVVLHENGEVLAIDSSKGCLWDW